MLSGLTRISPVIEATFAEASEVLGYDLWRCCQEGPAEALDATECTQPAMLTAGVATYRAWRERGGARPSAMAGHSLGEFTALVAAGCMEFTAAVDLVRFRAAAMQAAVPPGEGAMAAVIGLSDLDVTALCSEAAESGVVEAVNFNAPGQVVIAGTAAAVARAIELATARGARRVLRLPVSVPSHSSLMLPAAEQLRAKLNATPILPPSGIAVYGVDVKPHTGADAIRAALVKQLHTPVLWAATVRTLIAAGANPILECGPGRILTGLNRRIDKNRALVMLSLEDPSSFNDALQRISAC
jgi:[acyl-carrier-protein] S-malonyltransferase